MRRTTLAIAAGLAGGLVMWAIYRLPPEDAAPRLVVRMLHRGASELAIHGGARAGLRVADPGRADDVAAEIAARTGLAAEVRDGLVVIEAPGVSSDAAERILAPLRGDGSLRLKLVAHDSPVMAELAQAIEASPPPSDLGIVVDVDEWDDPARQRRTQPSITARSPAAWRSYAARLPVTIPPGLELRTELRGDGRVRVWLLSAETVLSSEHVESATVIWDPVTSRPEVILRLTDDGAEILARVTSEHVGDMLAILFGDTVHAAPIIQGPLDTGSVTITMGSIGAQQADMEARLLARLLPLGPLASPIELVALEDVDADVSPATLRAALAIAAALAGLVVAAILFLTGARLAPLAPDLTAAPERSRWTAWRRLAITAGGIVAAELLPRVILPHIHLSALGSAWDGSSVPAELSVVGLGIMPVLSAFFLVELAALAVPRWRGLRHGGPDGRARLATAVAVVAIALALVQGFFVAVWLEGIGQGPWSPEPLVHEVGLAFRIVTAVTLAAGTSVLVLVAWIIDRHGLLNGYSALILAAIIAELAGDVSSASDIGGFELGLGCALIAAAIAATRWVLTGRRGSLRLPACGIVPVQAASSVLALASSLTMLGIAMPTWLEWASPSTPAGFAIFITAALVLSVLLSWLFSRPALLGGSATVVGGEHRFRRAVAASAGYILFLCAVYAAAMFSGAPVVDVAALAVAAAIAIDLVVEWRAWRLRDDLEAIWPVHRVQQVDILAAALHSAGIEVHTRGLHHRTLLHFFGPFVPVTILVPRGDAARAREILADL